MKQVLSNQEPKGTSDWLPEEFLIRKYIFDVWRRVCLRYGFAVHDVICPFRKSVTDIG